MAFGDFLSAGSGLIGSIIGGIGQKKANEQNLKINQMNNEFNERMLDKQLAFQQDMWNQTNEYNSAKSQRARLEEAGLNPYMMMSGGNAGTATSQTGGSASAASPLGVQNAGTGAIQGATAIGTLASQLAQTSSQIAKTKQETIGLGVDNDFKESMYRANLGEIWSRTDLNKAYKLESQLRYKFNNENFDNALMLSKAQTQVNQEMVKQVQAQTALSELQAEAQFMKNQVLPADLQLQLMQRLVDMSYKGQLTNESAAREYKAYCEANGIRINNEILEQTAPLMVQAINSRNYEEWNYNRIFGGSKRAYYDKALKGNEIKLGNTRLDYLPSLYGSEIFRNYSSGISDNGTLILDGMPVEYTEYGKDGRSGRRTIKRPTFFSRMRPLR